MPGTAPDVMREYDLAVVGYEETEYCVEGTAFSYELKGERGADGRWEVTQGGEAPYRTRIVVRRPIDPDRFSDTAVVEWNNVSSGFDASPDWIFFHRHLIAQGHAWVGVSAQKVGIDGGGFRDGIHLKLLAPDRYAELEHPGDAWAFDIFTQVGELLHAPAEQNPLGLVPEILLAAGESQSAVFLVTYINAVDPHARVFDGFFVHGRGDEGVTMDGTFIRGPSDRHVTAEEYAAARLEMVSKGERIRDDVRVPVLILQSETDLIVLGGRLAEQPDSERIRTWEMAGAAHADTYIVNGGRYDDGTLNGQRLADLLRPTVDLGIGTTDTPINAGPQQHYIGQAALKHLVDWASGGPPPPSAPRLARGGDGTSFELDANGNALGGIRTPWVDVPIVVLSGLGQGGDSLAFSFGRTEPFDEADLAARYPNGRTEYMERFEQALDATIRAGFILEEDRTEILDVAAHGYPLLVV